MSRKILESMPKDLLGEYDLEKPYLKDLTIDDLNNVSQAILEAARKGHKVAGACCCCTMCCAAAVTNSTKKP